VTVNGEWARICKNVAIAYLYYNNLSQILGRGRRISQEHIPGGSVVFNEVPPECKLHSPPPPKNIVFLYRLCALIVRDVITFQANFSWLGPFERFSGTEKEQRLRYPIPAGIQIKLFPNTW
jgi:hypothetical protein